MAEEHSPGFAKLGDTNYLSWVMRMEAELVRKKLWNDVVVVRVDRDGKTDEEYDAAVEAKMARRSAAKMEEARAEMVMRVEDPQLEYMRDPDPAVVWEELRRVHNSEGFITALARLRQLFTTKKNPRQSMAEWISQTRQRAYVLKQLSVPMPDLMVILAITLGLPPSYDSLTTNLDGTPANDLKLAEIITRLVNEELRQSTSTTVKARYAKEEDAALAISPALLTCFFCDKKGHKKDTCPERALYAAYLKSKNEKNEANVAMSALDDGLEVDADSDSSADEGF
jgi:hypothetical protein